MHQTDFVYSKYTINFFSCWKKSKQISLEILPKSSQFDDKEINIVKQAKKLQIFLQFFFQVQNFLDPNFETVKTSSCRPYQLKILRVVKKVATKLAKFYSV